MNKKKGLICLLVLIFLLQIAAPVGLIAYRKGTDSKTLENGTDYKFAVQISSIYSGDIYYKLTDGWDGNLYDIMYMDGTTRQKATAYANILTDENGYSSLGDPKAHHDDAPYIKFNSNEQKSFPLQRNFHIASDLSYTAFDTKHTDDVIQNASFYVLVRVYEGRAIVLGMFEENGQPLDKWISEHEQAIEEWSYENSWEALNARFSDDGT